MRTRMEFVHRTSLAAILTLGLAACNLPASATSSPTAPVSTGAQPSGQATSTSISSLPTPDWASIANHILASTPVPTPPSASGQNTPAMSLFHKPIPLSGSEESFSAISSENFLWKGSPIPYDDLTLYTTDCSQPIKVDSFSVTITTNTATTFVYTWAAMIITFNSDHTAVVSQNNVAVGNTLSISFDSTSTQTVNQDVPFMLVCGTNYTVAFRIDFNVDSGPAGFNSVDLHIVPALSVLPQLATPTPAVITFTPHNLNPYCLRGPDPAFSPIGVAMQGQAYPVTGRSEGGNWLFIHLSEKVDCWVPLSTGTASGDLSLVPALVSPPTPVKCVKSPTHPCP
jgi:hypothetical protein